ncbi:hypothetical protein G6L37_02545 [Agrobacterium rubi]|nr:hypothetical protein [Agrobacterium rubi]NTF24275.1 hypothetical protein [Agrobacterium rubi]
MSNANPFIIMLAAAAGLIVLTGCSLLPGDEDPDHPYRSEAEKVVSAVAAHTPINGRCRRIGAALVGAGIASRLAEGAGEVRHSELVSALAGVEWDASGCPAAAVPGLSFGTSDFAKQIANRAHKMAGML